MKFVDEASLYVKAGDGGRGCVSFRRESACAERRARRRGRRKGRRCPHSRAKKSHQSSRFQVQTNLSSRKRQARRGQEQDREGRKGPLRLRSHRHRSPGRPERGRPRRYRRADDQAYVAAKGGQGGRGNTRFVSPVHRVPTEFDEGSEGEERSLRLELKLLARIGIIGLAECRKIDPPVSTYECDARGRRLSVYHTYPFPGGDAGGDQNLVLADIPGIIEGASRGKGLGLQFLRHIERTQTLLWVIDAASDGVLGDY